jgi:menaquinone-dependent protoporphyrinogen oxidase
MKRVIVAYASKCGSTAEVAQSIGTVLAERGWSVDVMAVQKVKNLSGYQAAVLGTALRMGKPVGEFNRFVAKFKAQLNQLPLAVFSLGLVMRTDTPENRAMTLGFLQPVLEQLPAGIPVAPFGGKLDYQTLSPFYRWAFKQDKSGEMAPGDWRDWHAIQGWAAALAL